jgi:hypothetical protein
MYQAWGGDEYTYVRYLVKAFKLRDHAEAHKPFMKEENSLKIGPVICYKEYDYGPIVVIKCRTFLLWLISKSFSVIRRSSQCDGELGGR